MTGDILKSNLSSPHGRILLVMGAGLWLAGCGCMGDVLSPSGHEAKGLANLEKGDFKKAEEEIKTATSLFAREKENRPGNMGRTEYELATVYRKQNKLPEAEETYVTALVIFSGNPKQVSDADKKVWAKCLTEYAEYLRASDRAPEADIRERQAKTILDELQGSKPEGQ